MISRQRNRKKLVQPPHSTRFVCVPLRSSSASHAPTQLAEGDAASRALSCSLFARPATRKFTVVCSLKHLNTNLKWCPAVVLRTAFVRLQEQLLLILTTPHPHQHAAFLETTPSWGLCLPLFPSCFCAPIRMRRTRPSGPRCVHRHCTSSSFFSDSGEGKTQENGGGQKRRDGREGRQRQCRDGQHHFLAQFTRQTRLAAATQR